MMSEKGIDASSVSGSGKRGQILKEDVMKTGSSVPTTPVSVRAPSSTNDEVREERTVSPASRGRSVESDELPWRWGQFDK